MIEYRVVTLNGLDDVDTSDLTVLAKERWHVVACADTGRITRVILVRNIDPAREPSP